MESFKSLDPAMPEFQDLLVRLIPSVGLNFVSVQFFLVYIQENSESSLSLLPLLYICGIQFLQ